MSKKNWNRVIIVGLVFFVFLSFYQLPFYITKPGGAHELSEIVEVTEGFEEKGSFYITTVRMGKANVYSYLAAKVIPYQKIYEEEDIRRPEESDEAYSTRQLYYMENSTLNAVVTAFEAANKPYEVLYQGVYVLNVLPDFNVSKVLRPGDRITEIENQAFSSSQELIQFVKSKKAGDTIKVTFTREEDSYEEIVTLQSLPDGSVGMGIELVDDKNLTSTPEVMWNTNSIGGPSAGLLFSLEIYNQLVPSDITKGYEIAGTGTISQDGVVGRIGGIEQKIVAADEAGADIFLAPNDVLSTEVQEKYPDLESNYDAAVKTAKEIDTNMKIIPIKTFQEALEFLKTLEDKKEYSRKREH
ncbi:SepM family pheromone-processing serine protease [Bacillus sp. 2205SS5-2]|uniref:SepM family pheromone-processing serine protease n=1 Tax=Bacillus sp. 2205SS5-2 TaxID=3109031 RepID=UPI0030044714